jgi:diaminopimelate decarboxylase
MQIEGVGLKRLAQEVGTPFYCYSAAALSRAYSGWCEAFDSIGFGADRHQACFAVKANGALAVLRHLAELGAGFDIISEGELFKVLSVGGDPEKIVFSGPGKTAEALAQAVEAGVGLINVEAPEEIEILRRLAKASGRKLGIGLRLNPDLHPRTHPAIATGPRSTKFGLTPEEIDGILDRGAELAGLEIKAIAVHIGSQIVDLEPLGAAAQVAKKWAGQLRDRDLAVQWIDLGGGLGIDYDNRTAVPTADDLAHYLEPFLNDWDGGLITEPGRVIAGPAGYLVTRVVSIRERPDRTLLICDAGMSALLRPALYGAVHPVLRVGDGGGDRRRYDVVGPLCEAGDILAERVQLPAIEVGDLLAIGQVGAYGYVMASEYNARPRPVQVWIEGDRWHVITPRRTARQMLADDRLAPWQGETRR